MNRSGADNEPPKDADSRRVGGGMLHHLNKTGTRSPPIPTEVKVPEKYQRHSKVFSEEESH